jgi:hypothetical protein
MYVTAALTTGVASGSGGGDGVGEHPVTSALPGDAGPEPDCWLTTVLRPAGALDRAARSRLIEALSRLADSSDMVIVDLAAACVTAPRTLARKLRAPALAFEQTGRCLLLVGAPPELVTNWTVPMSGARCSPLARSPSRRSEPARPCRISRLAVRGHPTSRSALTALRAASGAAFLAHPFGELLATMPGIGPRTGARILAEIGEGSAFRDGSKLAAYAGLAPVTRQSGTSLAGEIRSRRGNHRLKNAMFLAAFASLRDPASKAFYGRTFPARLRCAAYMPPPAGTPLERHGNAGSGRG